MKRDHEIGSTLAGRARQSRAHPIGGVNAISRIFRMNFIAAFLLSSFLQISGAVGADTAALTEAHEPGTVFKDCDICPEMVVIPAGSFGAENLASKAKRGGNKGPKRQIDVQSFAIGKTEVTQAQWKAVMGSNPSKFSDCGDACPVERVSWQDVQEFIRRLNVKTGRTYRLPSDAEWEYACRAGRANKYCGSEKIEPVAWYESNSNRTTHQVAGKQPNAWGLYDMTGNVWEWTQDCDSADSRDARSANGAPAVGDCERRTIRGGSWDNIQRLMHSAYRSGHVAKSRAYDVVSRRSDLGLRLAATLR